MVEITKRFLQCNKVNRPLLNADPMLESHAHPFQKMPEGLMLVSPLPRTTELTCLRVLEEDTRDQVNIRP